MIEDLQTRIKAIDPAHSFIVQAPAGSGKTELLMQRILTLLLTVQEPEEIIALTFTKKAVEEMRHRVISTLLAAYNNEPITSEHQQKSRDLALAVLDHGNKHQWGLLDSPHRLNISTIDALCLKICQGSPKETLLSLDVSPLDNPIEVYQKAIQSVFTDKNSHLQSELKTLLLHCDNHFPTIERLLCQLIAQREQWLPLVMPFYHQPEALKKACEEVIYNILQTHLDNAFNAIPFEVLDSLWQSILFSKQQCDTECEWKPLENLLEPDPTHLEAWLHTANVLLTKDGNWRSTRSINKTLGFSKDFLEEKKACQTLLETLSGLDNQEQIQQALVALRACPDLEFNPNSWHILKACLMTLPEVVAQCHLLFQAMSQCDYVELSLAACRVLDHDNASQKALILNHKISHILVDECQDTSLSQAKLLALLTQHWDSSEHKTLFFVGDPMQSIYRFRQAEVSLFHQWQTQGLGHIKLEPLQLSSNFRSATNIVEWFNDQFINIFPSDYNDQHSGIPYAEANAVKASVHNIPTESFIIADGNQSDEANQMIPIIKNNLDNDQTIAILLQKRNQALPVITALKENNLAFAANDIEPLTTHALALDWLMCLSALCDFDNKIAWTALLRSPICGANLEILFNLNQASQEETILNFLINNQFDNASLSHFAKRLQYLMKNIDSQPLWRTMDVAWHDLGFSDFYNKDSDYIIYNQCQKALKNLNWHRHIFDYNLLYETLEKTYCESQTNAAINIMTIHKSKGLEFDTVIIPGLQTKPRPEDKSLITWQTILLENQPPQFCIAPLASKEQKQNKVYDYCRLIEKQKLTEERKRLLYVACTRAKNKLVFFSILKSKEDSDLINEQFKPNKGSFAEMLWPFFIKKAQVIIPSSATESSRVELPKLIQPTKKWLNQKLINPSNTQSDIKPSKYNEVTADLNYFIHQNQAQHLGDAIHLLCEHIHKNGLNFNYEKTIQEIANLHHNTLISQDTIIYKLKQALAKMQQDPKAQWLFANHKETHSEWVILEKQSFEIKKHIIDYSFVDNDTRWIIDFKSAVPHKNESEEAFLQNQLTAYKKQLQRYKDCLKQTGESRPIRSALYFPLCGLWIESSGMMSGLISKLVN